MVIEDTEIKLLIKAQAEQLAIMAGQPGASPEVMERKCNRIAELARELQIKLREKSERAMRMAPPGVMNAEISGWWIEGVSERE